MVVRTARVCLGVTPAQSRRCFGLLRSGGDVWAWVLDCNRTLRQWRYPPVVSYQGLCRELAGMGVPFGELSATAARSVLRRYSDAWFAAAAGRAGQGRPGGYPRRKRALMPLRWYAGTFILTGRRLRLSVAAGRPPLLVRLARAVPYPASQVRSVTLVVDGGRLAVDVTAEVPVQVHDLDPARVAGVDMGVIHPYAVVSGPDALLVSGRAGRAEHHLHLADTKARSRAHLTAGPHPRPAPVAAVAAGPPGPTERRHRPSTADPSRPAPRRHPGDRLGRRPPSRHPGRRRPQRHHRR